MEIKIALAQMNVIAGQPQTNLARMIDYTQQAKNMHADIIVFPELAISGYLLGDLWEYEYFLHECETCGQKLIEQSDGITIIFGNVAIDWRKIGADGRVRKYNACFVAQDKKLLSNGTPYPFHIKTMLSDYRQFEDSRHFSSGVLLAYELGKQPEELIKPTLLNIKDETISIGCLIGEDCHAQTGKSARVLADSGAELLVNIASSAYYLNKTNANPAQNLDIPLIYLNHTGVQNNGKNIYAYDGGSRVCDKSGRAEAVLASFQDELSIFTYDTLTSKFTSSSSKNETISEIQSVFSALRYSLTHFFAQNKITKMVTGLSGGIDSAVAAALFTHILGAKNVLLINMPSAYNSTTTIDLARQLARNLHTHYAELPIEKSVALTASQIELIDIDGQKLKLSDFALENVQARDRSSRILAAAAAAFGGVFSCNANKSEITVGYGTFYGDLAGALAPLGDLWKHQVYALGRYLNEQVYQEQVIPEEIFTIRPSAELSPAQTVGNGGDPLCYPYHDYLFKAFVEMKLSPVEIASYYDKGLVEEKIGCQPGLVTSLFPNAADFFADLEKWWLCLGGLAAAKRIQAPPIIAISQCAFGRDAQLQAGLSEKYTEIKNRNLQ